MRKYFSFFTAGGYELIYSYLNHILGVAGAFSGVQMHMGHAFGHLHSVSAHFPSTVSRQNQQRFLQSGTAMWMANQKREVPCCDLKWIGGDGTGIGIPLSKLTNMIPVWEPGQLAQHAESDIDEFENKRMGRIVVQFENCSKSDARTARRSIRDMLCSTTSQKQLSELQHKYNESYHSWVPKQFHEAFQLWGGLSKCHFKKYLRSLLHDIISEVSASFQVPCALIGPLGKMCTQLAQPNANRTACLIEIKSQFPEFDQGILWSAYMTLFYCPDDSAQGVVVNVLSLLGETQITWERYFDWLFHSVLRANEVWAGLRAIPVPDHATPRADLRAPYPPTDGYRSFFSQTGRAVRDEWPLPKLAEKLTAFWEHSSSGCSKLRVKTVSKKQRSGLFLFMCMKHETLIAYHIMKHGEGRRDVVLPLYKFMEMPPEAVFCDTACHCEETGMNWLPHHFKDVRFTHDIFHSYGHLCPGLFDSKRSPKYHSIQTSLVEQCNSYLQALRGVCKSGTMRLATFMFWIEVFAVDWNRRKMASFEAND